MDTTGGNQPTSLWPPDRTAGPQQKREGRHRSRTLVGHDPAGGWGAHKNCVWVQSLQEWQAQQWADLPAAPVILGHSA